MVALLNACCSQASKPDVPARLPDKLLRSLAKERALPLAFHKADWRWPRITVRAKATRSSSDGRQHVIGALMRAPNPGLLLATVLVGLTGHLLVKRAQSATLNVTRDRAALMSVMPIMLSASARRGGLGHSRFQAMRLGSASRKRCSAAALPMSLAQMALTAYLPTRTLPSPQRAIGKSTRHGGVAGRGLVRRAQGRASIASKAAHGHSILPAIMYS